MELPTISKTSASGSGPDVEREATIDQDVYGPEDHGPEDHASLRKIFRKIDWRVIPLLFLCYLMGFVDKVAYNVSERIVKLDTHNSDAFTVCRGYGYERGPGSGG